MALRSQRPCAGLSCLGTSPCAGPPADVAGADSAVARRTAARARFRPAARGSGPATSPVAVIPRLVPLLIHRFLLGVVSGKAEIEPAEELVSVSTTQRRKLELITEAARQVW